MLQSIAFVTSKPTTSEEFQIFLETSSSKLFFEKKGCLHLNSEAQIALIPLPPQTKASFISFIIKYEFQGSDEGAMGDQIEPEEREITIAVKVNDEPKRPFYSRSDLIEENFVCSLFEIISSPKSASILCSLASFLIHRIFSSYPTISQKDYYQRFFLQKEFLFNSLLISEESLFSPSWNSLLIYELV